MRQDKQNSKKRKTKDKAQKEVDTQKEILRMGLEQIRKTKTNLECKRC